LLFLQGRPTVKFQELALQANILHVYRLHSCWAGTVTSLRDLVYISLGSILSWNVKFRTRQAALIYKIMTLA